MQLEQFRKSKNFSHKKLAQLFGTDPSTVFRWCKGERTPRPKFMNIIKIKTNGKVKPSSFYE